MEIVVNLEQSEQAFIQACIRKERWAQQKLYEDHFSTMMAVCIRYAGTENEAMDILHEGFIKVFKHISKYQPNTSIVAWMRRIMVNTSIDYYRKNVRRRSEDIETAYDVKSLDPTVVESLSAEEILLCLKQLSSSYRAVFNLYVIEGYAHKEIAEILEITESTSRSNLVKARVKLREILLKKEIGNEG